MRIPNFETDVVMSHHNLTSDELTVQQRVMVDIIAKHGDITVFQMDSVYEVVLWVNVGGSNSQLPLYSFSCDDLTHSISHVKDDIFKDLFF